MKRSELIRIIAEADNVNADVDPETIMDAYHSLDDLNEHHLGELIDDYILGKLDERLTTIFKGHLSSCDRCKKEVAFMNRIISEAKEIRDQIC